jgi:hypothetical protein
MSSAPGTESEDCIMANPILEALAKDRAAKAKTVSKPTEGGKADTASVTVEGGMFVVRFPVRPPAPSASGKCALLSKAVLPKGANVEGVPIAGTFCIRVVG